MGVNFEVSPPENQLLTKEDCFFQLAGKQICAKMDVSGEIEGVGCLLISVKDAIRLGGTLIMLPPAELEEVVRNGEYSEETEDSYGEIANIIAGSYTKVFEEMYPDSCRFVRKEQDVLAPLKVDIESVEPVPNQAYYQSSSAMTMEGVEMGNLVMLIPAETFGLDTTGLQTEESSGANVEPAKQEVTEPESAPEEIPEEAPAQEESVEAATDPAPLSSVDLDKTRSRIDSILDNCRVKMADEVGALLGVEVQLTDLDNRPVTKEDFFFEETSGKQVLAHMEVKDEQEDKSFLFVSLKDSIRIGGVLIMLPPAELDVAISEEDFTVDAEDAYGEIANIISGVYTAVFQERFSDNIRFVKTDLEVVAPMKVDIDGEKPIPNQLFYMSSSQLTIEDKQCGKVQMLFPAKMLGLEGLGIERDTAIEETQEEPVEKAIPVTNAASDSTEIGVASPQSIKDTEILVVGDDEIEIAKIQSYVKSIGLSVSTLSFQDNVNNSITERLKVILLVMKEVNEQGFGAVIKVSSACSVPLVVAGPGWTRTKVITAVKYGVADILLTPANEDDIKDKIQGNMIQLAA